jgi:hypothetical protein
MCQLYFSNSTNITSYCNIKSIKKKDISLCWQKFEIDFEMFISSNLFEPNQIISKYNHDYYKRLLLERLNVLLDLDDLIFFYLNDLNNNEKVILYIEHIEFCELTIDDYLDRRKNCSIEEQVFFFKPMISSIFFLL